MKTTLLGLVLLLLAGCVGLPEGVSAVQDFELDRYLGRWYEIARLDHPFERGLTDIRAEYRLRGDGGVQVINRGFDPKRQAWKAAEGKAYFVESPRVGRLKVSFFGPFYSSYNVIELDRRHYSYALVSGPSREYLWLLAREKKPEPAVVRRLVDQARGLGFPVNDLIYVEQRDLPNE